MDDIREVFLFEMLISDALSNTLLRADQGNIINIECDNIIPNLYTIKMHSVTNVENFRQEITITNQVLNECDNFVGSIPDPFEKVKAINHFVTNQLTYNNEKVDHGNGMLYAYTEIDALCYNTGTTCAGYCNLFKLLCERYGIPTKHIENSPSDEEYHAWSANFIDGNWYHTDTTWNENWQDYFFAFNRN